MKVEIKKIKNKNLGYLFKQCVENGVFKFVSNIYNLKMRF
jgi:hypothetical protein